MKSEFSKRHVYRSSVHSKGLSLVEMSVGLALGAMLIALVSVGVRAMSGSQNSLYVQQGLAGSAIPFSFMVKSLGRLADDCTRTSPTILDCTQTSNGDVRFTLTANGLEYQIKNGSGTFVTHSTLKEAIGFEICDATIMQAGTCPIAPAGLSNAYRSIASAPAPTGFFRYRIVSESKLSNGVPIRNDYQSAFFIRKVATVFSVSGG